MKIAICDKIGLCYDGTTLAKHGLGGSESAVILMSKELQQLGFSVTVFNNCNDSTHSSEGIYDGVRYIDNSNAENHNEEYDIVIVSRTAEPFLNKNRYPFLKNAKMKALWLHDTFCEGDQYVQNLLLSGEIDYLFTLSDFHTNYVLNCDHGQKRNYEVLKHKVFQTRNGAVKYIDEVNLSKKDKNHFVYNASVTKGLIPLLEHIWPEIKKQIPRAHLTVIGGYYRFREGAEPDAQEKTLRKLVEDDRLKELDITFTDVIPQPKIAEILSNASFMLYPGAFPETFGISTLESLLYNTPLITTKFGALEETAVAGACYTMDFAIEPNNLFPYINKEEQVKQFVQLAVDAYNNPYLLQQKQNYCSVVHDVAGWDSVAIEWKRFFYHKLGKFLPAEDYRVSKIISQKVNRIFGRVNNMPNYREYISFGKQRGILIVSPFYNCEKYISNCILSVAQQDYENYVHVLIDDCSTDNSFEVARQTLDALPPEVRSKFSLQKNLTNRGAVYNQITAIDIHGEDDDIVVLLDGDDWLVNNNTLFHLYNDYYNYGAEFTYGSCWSLVDNIPLVAQDYPLSVKQNRSYREHKFNWNMPYTHLRTFKKSLLNDIDHGEFKDETGEWYRAGGDGSVFYSLIERANPDNIIALKEIVYAYNDINPLNDYKINSDEQNRNAAKILNKNKLAEKDQTATNVKNFLKEETKLNRIEQEYMKYMSDLEINPNVIYDIGSNVLEWTRAAKQKWNNSKYIAFEAIEEFDEIYSDYGIDHHLGVLSDHDGKDVEFYQNLYLSRGSSYYKESDTFTPHKSGTGFTENHKVIKKTKRLDSVVTEKQFPMPDLIKIDVQGAELDILKGAEKCLKHATDIFIELQHKEYNDGAPHKDEVIRYLNSKGFHLVSNIFIKECDGEYHFSKNKSHKEEPFSFVVHRF